MNLIWSMGAWFLFLPAGIETFQYRRHCLVSFFRLGWEREIRSGVGAGEVDG